MEASYREHFRRLPLNVHQYGEIVVTKAFRGEKKGDSQHGYDIETSKAEFICALQRAGMGAEQLAMFDLKEKILIEVKSKLNETSSGKANVVHCGDSKMAMTHLAVVLVNPGSRVKHGNPAHEGLIVHAWLMTRSKAFNLRPKPGKEQYIRVNQIKEAAVSCPDVFDIKEMLSTIVDA